MEETIFHHTQTHFPCISIMSYNVNYRVINIGHVSHSHSVAGCRRSLESTGSFVFGFIHFTNQENLFLNLLFLLRSVLPSCVEVFCPVRFFCRRVSAGRLLRVYAIRSLNSKLSSGGIWTSQSLCSLFLVIYANRI